MAGSRQYHYVANQKTWYEAQAYCRERYTDLATISDSEELNSLYGFGLTQNISGSVWIGLYNDRHDWKWSAGSSDYRNWQSTTSETDPSNMAAEEYAVTYTGHWGNHWSCLAHNFICYDGESCLSLFGSEGPSFNVYVKKTKSLSWLLIVKSMFKKRKRFD